MSKRKRNEYMEDDGNYVVKKNRKMNIVAFVLCFLVAFVIWIYATNNEKKNVLDDQSGSTGSSARITASQLLVGELETGV